MKTFTDPQERIKQVLILSISTSLLLIILIYTYWLHGANKESIEDSVQKDIRNISTMVNGLSELKKKELKALAIRLGQGPVFKGAVSTGHQMTIEDMLTGLLKKINYSLPPF